MDEITADHLERLNEALPMMMQELIALASSGKVILANNTAEVILGELGNVIDFASKVLETNQDR
jgi:hypothetical protein